MPSKKETLTVIVIMALFLLLTAACIGLRSEHLLMAALYLVLFFAGHEFVRKHHCVQNNRKTYGCNRTAPEEKLCFGTLHK